MKSINILKRHQVVGRFHIFFLIICFNWMKSNYKTMKIWKWVGKKISIIWVKFSLQSFTILWWIYGCWGFNNVWIYRQKYIEWEEKPCSDAENYGLKFVNFIFLFFYLSYSPHFSSSHSFIHMYNGRATSPSHLLDNHSNYEKSIFIYFQ